MCLGNLSPIASTRRDGGNDAIGPTRSSGLQVDCKIEKQRSKISRSTFEEPSASTTKSGWLNVYCTLVILEMMRRAVHFFDGDVKLFLVRPHLIFEERYRYGLAEQERVVCIAAPVDSRVNPVAE